MLSKNIHDDTEVAEILRRENEEGCISCVFRMLEKEGEQCYLLFNDIFS